MDKRYQVFVSSTFEDLQEERKEVMQALLELDCIPAGMELFPAANEDQWTLIKRVIDDCDYYILIIGGRYGSTNEDGISYTQMEYEYAVSTGKPVIAFLHKNPANIPSGKSEQDSDKKKKLEEFKELAKKKLVKYWEGADNLGSVVSRSMIRLIKDNPSDGWVKAGSIVDENSIAEIARLQKENDDLKNQISKVSTEAPLGSEELAQGEDTINVEFDFQGSFYVLDNFLEKEDKSSCVNLTWNQIFLAIAPSIMTECYEYGVKKSLNNFLAYYSSKTNISEEYPNYSSFDNFEIKQTSFDIIKIQLRALGYISLSFKGGDTYWKLTQYGDYMMTQNLAIKKDK